MRTLKHLFENNRAWAEAIKAEDPEFFQKLAGQQSPEYLWIDCADSRVPANQIIGMLPGEVFVHRNVVVHTDLNCLSVMQFAVDVLKVEHIIVCGHYGHYDCGGDQIGLIDNWLRHIVDVREKHRAALAVLADEAHRWDRLCELNVIEQVASVCQTTIVRDAWARGQELAVHGWIYTVGDGLLRDLKICVAGRDELAPLYEAALVAMPLSIEPTKNAP